MDVIGVSKPLGLSKQGELCQRLRTAAPPQHLSPTLHMVLVTEVPSPDTTPEGQKE